MAITTTPTAGMITALETEIQTQFQTGTPPSSEADIRSALAAVLAKAIELALTEVKDNADVTGVAAGSDTVSGGVV